MVTVVEAPRTGRVMRRPQHTFQIRHRPFQIQPFLIAPVLPGETMRNLLVQARVVTDPIKNPLVGWWYELYVFYVKHRDLLIRDDVTRMVLEPEYAIGHAVATNVRHYHLGSGIDWVQHCLDRVVDEYFRDEGEAVTIATIDTMPVAAVNSNGWWDSAVEVADLDAGDPTSSPDTQSELDTMRLQWEFMRANQLTKMDYEDFLATYGVRTQKQELHKPELIRYVRDWTYPSNTVDAATGVPSSACSWAIAERADKDRFFAEPGFIFGCAVARPKVYLSKVYGAGVGMMNDAMSWLPAILREDVYTSLKKLAAASGRIAGATQEYVVDVRDLLIHGDQFVNFAVSATDASFVALPSADLGNKKYPSAADVDGLFAAASPANQVRADGIVTLAIHGTQVDHT